MPPWGFRDTFTESGVPPSCYMVLSWCFHGASIPYDLCGGTTTPQLAITCIQYNTHSAYDLLFSVDNFVKPRALS